MSDKAVELKNKGNAAFQAGNYQEAVDHFSAAIELDGSNHVLYSNRSGAYAGLKNFKKALEDADKTISLKPDWPRGYSRKGLAHFNLDQLEEATKAYEEGLKIDPENAAMKEALMENLLRDPTLPAKVCRLSLISLQLRANPKTAAYLEQPDFLPMLERAAHDAVGMQLAMKDPRFMDVLMMQLAASGQFGGGEEAAREAAEKRRKEKEERRKKEEEEERQRKEEEEKARQAAIPEYVKEADALKEKGNAAYKKKDFEEALKFYGEAREKNPSNITYLNNTAAVYYEMGKYEECRATCEKALEEGYANRADFKLLARAQSRIGNCFSKEGNLEAAIKAYNSSLSNFRDPAVLKLLQDAEKRKREAEIQAYIDPEKALEEKNKGNTLFSEQNYPEAVKAYTESIKRNPKDHIPYSNRAACYLKLLAYPEALKDANKCIELAPDFAKGYLRKGHAEFWMNEYAKALATYEQGLKHDPANQELRESFQRTMLKLNTLDSKEREKQREAAQNDPEVQEIMADPVMRQLLNDMSQNPGAAQEHLKNPIVAAKIEKLIAAGIISVK